MDVITFPENRYTTSVLQILLHGVISLPDATSYNKRIYHECYGRREKIIMRIAVCHHEACRVMTNGDSEGRIFPSYPHTNNGFVFLPIPVFYFKKASRSP